MRTFLSLVSISMLATATASTQGRSPHPLQHEAFDIPNARLTRPFGVNASGDIAGLYRDAANANHGFIRHPKAKTT